MSLKVSESLWNSQKVSESLRKSLESLWKSFNESHGHVETCFESRFWNFQTLCCSMKNILCHPFFDVFLHLSRVRKFDVTHQVFHGPSSLSIKHGVSVVLILHSHVKAFVVAALGVNCPLVQIGWVKFIRAPESDVFSHKWKMIEVSRAKDDGIDIGCASIGKVNGFPFNFGEKRPLADLRRPFEAHWSRPVGANHLFSSIFDRL